MKKLLSMILALALVFSLCACSVEEDRDFNDDNETTEEVGDVFGGFFDRGDDSKDDSEDADATTKYQDEPAVTTSKMTTSQANALESAKSYLRYSAFSYEGLIDQLEYEGYPHEDCVFAVDNCGADWFEQAVKCGKSYLKYSSFSYAELVDQLEYEGFTSEQAKHGADEAYGDNNDSSSSGVSTSKQNALESAKSYLKYSAFSYEGLIDQLEYEGYPHEDCVYAVDNCGADWFEQAVKCGKSYLKYSSFSYSELVDQLEYEGFTNEQAVYGAKQNGL